MPPQRDTLLCSVLHRSTCCRPGYTGTFLSLYVSIVVQQHNRANPYLKFEMFLNVYDAYRKINHIS